MKTFNLSRALYGDPVVTRDGRKVTEIKVLTSDINHQVVAVIDSELEASLHTKEGKYSLVEKFESNRDLFMAPKTEKRWVNLYRSYGSEIVTSVTYKSLKEAEDFCCKESFVKTIEVEIPV